MSEPLVDIGLNLTNKQFASDREEVVERALAAGVTRMMVTGLSAELSQAALELARQRPGVLRSTAGVHPHNAKTFDRHTQAELRALAAAPEVAAVGECGLDYDRNFSPPEQQRHAFEAQLALAVDLAKPVFLHVRSAHDDFVRMLSRDMKRAHGRRNEPAFLPHIAASVARARGEAESDVARHTSATAERVFGLGAGVNA